MPRLLISVTRNRIHMLAVAIWLMSIFIQSPVLYALASSPHGQCYTNWNATGVVMEYTSAVSLLLLVSIVPSVLIGIAYKRTASTIKRSLILRSSLLSGSTSPETSIADVRRNPTKVFFVCYLAHAICSMPYNLLQVCKSSLLLFLIFVGIYFLS